MSQVGERQRQQHVGATTSDTSSGYSAAYGTAGNLYCRAPSASTTCASDPTSGQQLSYDVEHRPVGWQSAPSGGFGSTVTPSTDSSLYDGEGRRVEQDAVQQLSCPPQAPTQGSCGSSTTDTVYLSGDAEEIASNGSIVTSTTKTYSAGGLLLGTLIASGGTESLHVLASDGLGSVTLALDTSGNLTAQQLYDPYGNVRYSFGSMPTAKGYTGQQGDALTGLDYYTARYYDPLVGQFLTPDSVDAGGLNRYAYVGGNPETRTDPRGHCPFCIMALVGAVAGAAISFTTQVVVSVQSGQSLDQAVGNVNWGDVGKAALVGAVVGFTGGAAGAALGAGLGVVGVSGAVADIGAGVAVGAGEGALGQVGDNVLHGRTWSDDLGQAALFGAATGGAGAAGGKLLRRVFAGAADAAASDAADATDTEDGLWSPADFNGKRVYQRDDLIDPARTDRLGRTSLDRMQAGNPPIGPDGQAIVLHHMLQMQDGTLIELPASLHQRYFGLLHINIPTTAFESGINRSLFGAERTAYWMWRARDFS